MSRPPSVSQLLKRAGLAKRARATGKSSSTSEASINHIISNKNGSTLKRKLSVSDEKEAGELGVEEPKDDGVDDRIAALERELEQGTDSSEGSSSSDTGDDSDVETSTGKREGNETTGVFKFVSSLEAEKIEPLPVHLLPLPGCGMPKRSSSREEKRSKVTRAPTKQSSGLDSAVKELLDNYEARSSERLPFYCRVCKFQGESLKALEQHRREPLHQETVRKERKISKCTLCNKQFTSPPQLQEHLSGKAHLEKLQATMARQGKRVPGNRGTKEILRPDKNQNGKSRHNGARGGSWGLERGFTSYTSRNGRG